MSHRFDDVIEGGRPPRRGARHGLIVGLAGVGFSVVVVWAALSLFENHPEPPVKPTAGPSLTPASPVEVPLLDPADAEERLQARSIQGRLSLIMGQNRISMVVPATPGFNGGWTRYGRSYLSKNTVGSQGAEAVFYWTYLPGGGWADPCPGLVSFPAGSTVHAVAAAVSTVPGVTLVSGPSTVNLGGLSAQHLVLTIREDLGCDPGYFYTWQAVAGGPFWAETGVGDTIRVWIVDMGGPTPLFVAGETTPEAGRDLEREIQLIVDSISFD